MTDDRAMRGYLTQVAISMVLALALTACGDDPISGDTTASTSTTLSTTLASTSTTVPSTTTSSMPTTSTEAVADESCPNPAEDLGAGARFAFCGWSLVALPTSVDGDDYPTLTATLGAFIDELVAGPTADEATTGIWSAFGDVEVATTATLSPTGSVVVDFDDGVVDLIGPSPSGHVAHSFTLLIWATAFQFEEVENVVLTVDGDCDTMGTLIMSACQTIDRDLWKLMVQESDPDLVDARYSQPTASLADL